MVIHVDTLVLFLKDKIKNNSDRINLANKIHDLFSKL